MGVEILDCHFGRRERLLHGVGYRKEPAPLLNIQRIWFSHNMLPGNAGGGGVAGAGVARLALQGGDSCYGEVREDYIILAVEELLLIITE